MRSKALVLLLFVGVTHLISEVRSLKPDDKPELPVLQRFYTPDGKSMDLLQEIGIQYEEIGLCLLDDATGAKLGAIELNNQNVKSKMKQIFEKWLQGSGKRPETWTTLVICLRQIGMNSIADSIEAVYPDSSRSPTAPETDTVTRKSTTPQRQPAAESKDDEVKDYKDIIQAVEEIGDWHGLCINLGVSEGKISALLHSTDTVEAKITNCLKAYFDEREAKWSDVIRAVARHPIKNKRIAKKIAKTRGLDFNEVVKDEL